MQRLFRSGGRDNGNSSPETLSPPPLPSETPPRASSATGPARPIRFVYCDEKGKFRIDPEALATLQLVKEPIGVVSVCGRARQGKSFILNQVPHSISVFWYLFCVFCHLLGLGFLVVSDRFFWFWVIEIRIECELFCFHLSVS